MSAIRPATVLALERAEIERGSSEIDDTLRTIGESAERTRLAAEGVGASATTLHVCFRVYCTQDPFGSGFALSTTGRWS